MARWSSRFEYDVLQLFQRKNSIRFNPRAHAGRDLDRLNSEDIDLFQSTRPRGARRNKTSKRSLRKQCFNPRAHAGRDKI